MNKYSIVFALNYYDNPDQNKNHYLMLYYALETLYSHLQKDIDVFVLYDIKRDIPKKFNIFTDFPKVNFIEVKYKISEDYQKMFYKWYCVDFVLSNHQGRFLILDLDVIFNKDPIYIFKKYNNENKFYCLEESRTPPEIQLLICKPKGINGGQILLSSTIYQKLKKLYNNLLDERQIIKKKIEQLDGYHQDWIMNDLSDQYALTNLLHKRKINLSFFDVEDICFGPECQPSKIFHYFSSLNKNYLPQKFLQRN